MLQLKFIVQVFFLIIIVLLSSNSFGQDDKQAQINNILKEVVPSESAPGITIGVVKDGQLLYQSYRGNMNLEYQIPFNESTVFGLASVTKQFTAACIAILERQGKLSTQDDVRKYIPELEFYGDTIRVQHLLNHTSGIRNHNVLLDLAGFDYEHQGYTNESIQQLMFRQKGVNNRPGDKMLYSNTNYVLLALIVERVSGMKIHEFAQNQLFMPLGMQNSFYKSDLRDVIENRAYSYYQQDNAFKQKKSLTLCVGAGGMVSTIPDLAKWMQIFLQPEQEFSYIAQFITELNKLNNGQEMKHARGMFVSPYKGYTTYNHSGRDIGMRSQFICLPELNLGIIVFANSASIDAVGVSYNILDLWLPNNSEEKAATSKYQHKKKVLESFTGYYQELNSDLRMQILFQEDSLRALSSFGRMPVPLVASAENQFHRVDNASVNYVFVEDDTEADLLVDFGGAIFYFERIELNPEPNQNLTQYVGEYYSEELDVKYTITVSEEGLQLDYPNNYGLQLKEGQQDVFGANRRTKYAFQRNNENEIISFKVSAEGTVKDILFKKISN